MNALFKLPDIGDPSDIRQLIPTYNLELLCCRYWWLKNWEFRELSFPYWRIYRNSQPGATIVYNNKEFELLPDTLIMIAPNTSFASRLFDHAIPESGYCLVGDRISQQNTEEKMADDGAVLHFFLHFNLGMPYDNVASGIYLFRLTEQHKQKIETISKQLLLDSSELNFYTVLTIQSLISELLLGVPESNWNLKSNDSRILNVLSLIENNISDDLSNQILADNARLATNAFNRLFRHEIGISPQRFVKKKRIDKACVLLHHFDYSIERVAVETGFADRYHFSKLFKLQTGLSPAKYRKEFGLQ